VPPYAFEFVSKKDAFYRVISDFPYLSEKVKKRMIDYLQSSYDGLDKRNTLIEILMAECKKF